MKIETRDTEGRPNGWILPCWSALEHPEWRPEQVYVTAIAPHARKGPHLHQVRRGMFVCLTGNVLIRWINHLGSYRQTPLAPDAGGPFIVKAGMSCALYNRGSREALVLNMPSPAWSKEDPDDWPVENWEDPPGWESR